MTCLASFATAIALAAVEPVAGQAAAAPPSANATPITATCSLAEHAGLDEEEVKTAADLICHELVKRGATNANHEIRFGKLGGRTLITLASHKDNTYDEVRTFITGLEEIEVAGPRLVSALIDGKPLEQTRTVDNVIASEQRAPKQQNGAVMALTGMYGTTSLGESSAASAGVELGIAYRARNFGIVSTGRAGGIGSADRKMPNVSLDLGGRYYVTDGEIAPVVGLGVEISYLNLKRKEGDLDGSGMGAYALVGLEALRTHHMGLLAAVRVDAPFYDLEGTTLTRGAPTAGGFRTSTYTPASAYAIPVSLTLSMVFH